MNLKLDLIRVVILLAVAVAAAALAERIRPHPLSWLGPAPSASSGTRFEVIAPEEAKSRLLAGTAFFIDARPAADFRRGHLAGAISVPDDELLRAKTLPGRVHEYLPAGGFIVIYDSAAAGPSGQGVAEFLVRDGIRQDRLRLLAAGWDELRGWPVAPGPPEKKP